MKKNQKSNPKNSNEDTLKKIKQGQMQGKRSFVALYAIAFLVVLFGILYMQFSYIESEVDLKSNKQSQQQQKQQQQNENEFSKHSQQHNLTEYEQSEQKIINTSRKLDKDEDVECDDIFDEKRDINIRKLLKDVKNDIDKNVQLENQKKLKLQKQLQENSKRNLTLSQMKQLFQKKEIEQMKQEVSDSDEKAQDTDSEEDKQKRAKNPQSDNISLSSKYKISNSAKNKYKKLKDKPNIERISTKDLQELKCFLDYYDSNEESLSFEMIKYCEFVENEYIQLKWKGKTSLYDLMIHFYNLLQIQDRNKVQWHHNTQFNQETVSTVFYYAKVMLNDLFIASKKFPELFQYQDPEIEEIHQIYNSLPMKNVVKNLVEVWENNWASMGLHDPSHISIKRKLERSKQFNEMMKNNTQTASSSRLKQQNSRNIKIENQEKEQKKEELKQTTHADPKSDTNNQQQNNQSNTPINQQSKENQQTQTQQKDESELASLYTDKPTQNNTPEKKQKVETDDLYFLIDDKELSYEDLESEELDDIVSLEEQVRILWKSKEWKNAFKGLEYNNYFLATRRKQKNNND